MPKHQTVGLMDERVRRREMDRNNIAVIATARYLVRVMFALLKHGTMWEEHGSLTAAA